MQAKSHGGGVAVALTTADPPIPEQGDLAGKLPAPCGQKSIGCAKVFGFTLRSIEKPARCADLIIVAEGSLGTDGSRTAAGGDTRRRRGRVQLSDGG